MEYTREELLEAKRQIDSTLHKLEEAVRTLGSKENPRRYQSQVTLKEVAKILLLLYTAITLHPRK